MVQKESSYDSDQAISNSPDLRVFCNLVERARSLQFLKEKNQGLENPLRNNFSAWQPSFEPEDFNLPPKRGSKTRAAAIESGGGGGGCSSGGGGEGKEEKRMKNDLKRPRHLVDLALLCVPEKGLKKGETSKVLLYDLNKEAESSEAVNGGFGLNLELGFKKS